MESMQKKFTRILLRLVGLNYKERLDRLRLFSMDHRRLRGNITEVYKSMGSITHSLFFRMVEMAKLEGIGLS